MLIDDFMTYEEYLRDVKKGIVTDLGNCPVTPLPVIWRDRYLDLKCDPLLIGSLRMEPGFLPAYRMHRGNWITVLLDGSVGTDTTFPLLEMSYSLTAPKLRK